MSSERSFASESMALRFRGLASIGCREDTTSSDRAWHQRCAGLVHTVAVRRRLLAVLARRRPARRCAAAACSAADGRALPPADPRAPRPARRRARRSSRPPATSACFTLRSTAFADGGRPCRTSSPAPVPAVSPDLSWTGTPADAESLALVVRDRDAGGFVHWVVTRDRPVRAGDRRGRRAGERRRGPQRRRHRRLAGARAPRRAAAPTPTRWRSSPCPASWPSRPMPTREQAAALLEASAGERAVLTGTVTAGGG